MDNKIKAFNLFNEGKSYKEIALALGIGKTTAYDYVKEIKLGRQNHTPNFIRNGSELVPNVRSEQKVEPKSENEVKNLKNAENSSKIHVPNVPNKKITKGFTGNDLLTMKFETLRFTSSFLELIGQPEKHFSGIIWGLPKGGKSNLSIRFADYLQEYFGDVLYVAAEEGMSVSMQEKIRAINGSNVKFYPSKNRDEIKDYVKSIKVNFVFIDSINVANIDDAFLEEMKQENPDKSFIAIVQATKGGNFKGEQSLEHNCDFVIKVVSGIAYHKGRFGPESEIPIFEKQLYEKNANKDKVVEKIEEIRKVEVVKKQEMPLPQTKTKLPPALQNCINSYKQTSTLTTNEVKNTVNNSDADTSIKDISHLLFTA